MKGVLVVVAAGAVAALGVARAEAAPNLCVATNGQVRVQHGTATCAADAGNIAIAKGDGSSAAATGLGTELPQRRAQHRQGVRRRQLRERQLPRRREQGDGVRRRQSGGGDDEALGIPSPPRATGASPARSSATRTRSRASGDGSNAFALDGGGSTIIASGDGSVASSGKNAALNHGIASGDGQHRCDARGQWKHGDRVGGRQPRPGWPAVTATPPSRRRTAAPRPRSSSTIRR